MEHGQTDAAQKLFQIISQYLFHILWPYRKFGCGWCSCEIQGKNCFLAIHPKKWKRYGTRVCKLCGSRGHRPTNGMPLYQHTFLNNCFSSFLLFQTYIPGKYLALVLFITRERACIRTLCQRSSNWNGGGQIGTNAACELVLIHLFTYSLFLYATTTSIAQSTSSQIIRW
jgi:hypothetical protein